MKAIIMFIIVLGAILAPCGFANGTQEAGPAPEFSFEGRGGTPFGEWQARAKLKGGFAPGILTRIEVELELTAEHIAKLEKAGARVDDLALLVTAERIFDAGGIMRFAHAELMSSLLTPTGLAIEGGSRGAVTDRLQHYWYRTPFDALVLIPLESTERGEKNHFVRFLVEQQVPKDIPPGIYRLRLDFGVSAGRQNRRSLFNEGFALRPFPKDYPQESYCWSPPMRVSNNDIKGRPVDANTIVPRVPWVILAAYNSNGYRGVIAGEDQPNFAMTERHIIPDEVILPLWNDAAKKSRIAYNLEPQFPVDRIDPLAALPWDCASGGITLKIVEPDGREQDFGFASFKKKKNGWPTTDDARLTAWKPEKYGLHTVILKGYIKDSWGNRYEGGGTYRFWIAKRMTMATATFQGMPYPVGARYGRDMAFFPPVPADVQVEASLYPDSDRTRVKTMKYGGRASRMGLYGAAQGMQAFPLDAPGEYHAKVLATHTDAEGHLWVCTMRHAGLVFPPDSTIVARGKKHKFGQVWAERGETGWEGRLKEDKSLLLEHINYPYYSGDVLLISSEGLGANKVTPVLIYETKDAPEPYQPAYNTIGYSNIRMKTSNGLSPHLFPEFITDREYFYASAPRPGLMSRFLVAESGTRAPYWPTSRTNFGGQIGAPARGDQAGDIYRLLGGVVLRAAGQSTRYAHYLASCFILPAGTNNNRIVQAGAEDLPGPLGTKARLFLVGARPGSMLEMGSTFGVAAQIDPILPAGIRARLIRPDGSAVETTGQADAYGSAAGKDRWTLDQAGVYKYWIEADWQGHKGYMPGMPEEGGYLFVFNRDTPPDPAGLSTRLPAWMRFKPEEGFAIKGASSCDKVFYSVIIPGAVISQGEIPVEAGKWSWRFDPDEIRKKAPIYETTNPETGKPELGRVVHISFFSMKPGAAGVPYTYMKRVVARGNEAVATE